MLRFYLMENGIVREDRELFPLEEPTLSVDRERELMWKLSGSFLARPDADLLRNHIFCRLDGEDCGEFVVSGCKSRFEGGRELWEIEACDQALLLQRNRQESRFFAAAGTPYMELLQSLLNSCGISRILADDCRESLAVSRQWELGESTLDMVNQLLEEMGFEPLWFDTAGRARLTAYEARPEVSKLYRSGDLLLAPAVESSWDVHSAQNVFLAVADSPERGESRTAIAVNDDPNSPISTVNLGRIMAPPLILNHVASQEALQTAAERLRDEKMLSVQTVRFETLPQVHEPHELVALEHPQLEAVYRQSRWELREGRMFHEGKRVMFL